MLEDMLNDVLNAKNDKEREKAYRNLERVGMDRSTVNILMNEYRQMLAKKGDANDTAGI